MPCKMCLERGKTWEGSEPVCAFDGDFAANWNCASLSAIRDLVYEGEPRVGVDYQYCDDQKYATVRLYDHFDAIGAIALWVCWYKSRGGTDAVWLLFEKEPPRRPTENECVLISYAFNNNYWPKVAA
jgi:hypothetical protein